MKSTFWMTAAETERELKLRETPPRCWQCGRRMSEQSRKLSPFCSHECEYGYNKVGEE